MHVWSVAAQSCEHSIKASHAEVTETANRVRSTFEGLLDAILRELVARGEL